MKKHLHFERFLASAEGQRVLERFNALKRDFENPAQSVVKRWIPQASPPRYLEIGGGTGARTLDIARKLKIRRIDFVEPSAAACKTFKRLAKRSGVVGKVFAVPFEHFETAERYDLITSIHSFYYINRSCLKKVHRMLAPGGRAFILIDSRSDIIKRIQDICERWQGEATLDFEDLRESLRRYGIPFRAWPEADVVRGLYLNRRFTAKAKTILSLLSWLPWQEIPEAVKEETSRLLVRASNRGCYRCRRVLIELRK